MIRSVCEISDLPREIVEEYKKHGLSDEEIFESLSDAIDFVNTHLYGDRAGEDISLEWIFARPLRRSILDN